VLQPLVREGSGRDPGTLFLNTEGRPLTINGVTRLVSELTLRYAQKRVTPHIFRDIWAYWWLASHPEDYLTVSKKLWHRTVEITLRVYGCRFDESQADCRVEEYFETCQQAPEHSPLARRQGVETVEIIRRLPVLPRTSRVAVGR